MSKRARLRQASACLAGVLVTMAPGCSCLDPGETLGSVERRLVASSSALSFGEVWLSTEAERAVELTAAGNAAVEVGPIELEGSARFRIVDAEPLTLAPGERAELRVRLAPNAEELSVGTLVVHSSAEESPLRVDLAGVGRAVPSCPPQPCHETFFDPAVEACAARPLENGSPCGGDDRCVEGELCFDGACVGTWIGDACTDGLACTINYCDPEQGCRVELNHGACDDDDPCTEDRCDAATGCVNEPVADYTPCGVVHGCSGIKLCLSGACVAAGVGPPAEDFSACDDGNGETVRDLCWLGICVGLPVEAVPFQSIDASGFGSTCQICHAPNGYNGLHSTEQPHPVLTLACIDCHGGDNWATNPIYAHVCPPPEVGNRQQQVLDPRSFFLRRTLVGVELLADYACPTQLGGTRTVSPLDWLAFVNPGDVRVGTTFTPEGNARGCGACHGALAEDLDGLPTVAGGDVAHRVERSLMATAAGLYTSARASAGIANRFPDRRAALGDTLADIAARALTAQVDNPGYVESTGQGLVLAQAAPAPTAAAVGESRTVEPLDPNWPGGLLEDSPGSDVYQAVLDQACAACHLASALGSDRPGSYRSAGCSACHTATMVDGRSRSRDPNVDLYEPISPDALVPGELVHRRDHWMRSLSSVGPPIFPSSQTRFGVSDDACLPCHLGSGGTALAYRGVRFDAGSDHLGRAGQGDLAGNLTYPVAHAVPHTYATELFGVNGTFAGGVLTQWIEGEVWQSDVADVLGGPGQDQTPDDIHHEVGLACIDCHRATALHGDGGLASSAKVKGAIGRIRCESCHGTLDAYAAGESGWLVDDGGDPLLWAFADDDARWLLSRYDLTVHHIPQVKDLVELSERVYPPGSRRAGEPLYSAVASAAMGRFQLDDNPLDGTGPRQPAGFPLALREGFSHSTADAGNREVACITCHAAWQNRCVSCHLDARWDSSQASFRYSAVDASRVAIDVVRRQAYANPISFLLGLGVRGKIEPFGGPAAFLRYRDDQGQVTPSLAFSDRLGLGADPGLRASERNTLPALHRGPTTPHTVRGRPTPTKIGARGCADCHQLGEAVTLVDQAGDAWDLTSILDGRPTYRGTHALLVDQAQGRGSGLWLLDADGLPVVDTNGVAVYDLDRVVEVDGWPNSGSAYPLLEGAEGLELDQTNGAAVARPLPAATLLRLQALDEVGLHTVYAHNLTPGEDPADTGSYVYVLTDYGWAP